MAIVTIPNGSPNDPIGSIITWPAEDFFLSFWRFCSISSLQTKDSITAAKWSDGRIPTLPIGQPISLSALVPGPGDQCPALTYPLENSKGNDSDSKTIDAAIVPPAAIIDYQWKIQVADYDKKVDPTFKTEDLNIFDAAGNPSKITQDLYATPGVDYTILSGTLNSKQLTIMPTPTSATRAFQIYLKVNLWWPSREVKTFQIPSTQGTAESHAKNTKWSPPTLYNLRCLLTPLAPVNIPKPPTDDIYSKFKSLCSAKSEQLKAGSFTDANTATTLAAQPIPVGQALSLISLLPTGIDIPKAGLPLPDGTSIGTPGALPVGAQVDVKWKIETVDFGPGEAPKSADFKPARPSLSHSDLGGRFEITSGGLSLPNLSLNIWPESSVAELKDKSGQTGRAPSQKKRAFQIRLEVTLTAPTRAPTTFYLPPPTADGVASYFVGVIDSWANTFGAVNADGTPKLAELPKVLGDLGNAPDPMQLFRGLLTTTMGDLTPDPGHVSNLLVAPTDKVKQLPSQIKEIVNKKPSTKIEAAIDLGASLDAVARSAVGAFGVKSDNNPAAAAALNVLDILTNIFSIPIAVDINGNTVTQTLTPLVPVPLPSLESVKGAPADLVPGGLGAPAIIGQVPIGTLKTLVGTCVNNISWVADSDNSPVQVSRLTDAFGLSFLPIPVFQAIGASPTNPSAGFNIRLRLNISLPGSSTPMTLDFDLARVDLKVPVVSIPQILVLTRFPLGDVQRDWTVPYANESLWFLDPPTARYFPNIGAIQAALATLGNTLKAIFKLFKAANLDAIDQTVPDAKKFQLDAFAGWTSLANTIGRMSTILASQLAGNPAGPMFIPAPADQAISIKGGIGSGPWYHYDDSKKQYDPAGVSSMMWIGAPQSDYGLQVHLDKNNLVEENFWFPSAYATPDTQKGFPYRGPGKTPYTKLSWTDQERNADGNSPDIWLTRHFEGRQSPPPALPAFHTESGLTGDFDWEDKIDYIKFFKAGQRS